MGDAELKRKLVEWAGFEWHPRPDVCEGFGVWITPEGKYKINPPNVTKSLDACFKHLVPKLQKDYEIVIHWLAIGSDDEPSGWSATIFGQTKGYSEDIHVGAETPSLALCLAIEKLIDKE